MASHLENQQDVHHCYLGETVCLAAFQSYKARYMPVTGKWLCHMPNCQQGREGKGCSNKANLLSHIAHHRPQDTVRIRGLYPPKCRLCGMQSQAVGSVQHEQLDQYLS